MTLHKFRYVDTMSRAALVAEVERFRASSAPMSRIHRAERQAETLLARAEAAEKALARVEKVRDAWEQAALSPAALRDLRAALDGKP